MSNQSKFELTAIRGNWYSYPYGKLKKQIIAKEVKEFEFLTSRERVLAIAEEQRRKNASLKDNEK